MRNRPPVHRPSNIDMEHVEVMRRAADESRELLKRPTPDTFLGRRTQEPFPAEGNAYAADLSPDEATKSD
jgi:hypothetical protein